MTRALLFTALTALGACAVLEPHYHQPPLPTPNVWPNGAASEGDHASVPDAPALPVWHAFYADPKLREVITQALANNRDLRVAALNIEAARAQYHVQRAQSLPSLDATASGDIQGSRPHGGDDTVTRQYTAGVGLSAFEIDLFGRVRSLNRAALQRYLATAEARDALQISLISEVASAYVTYAADIELLGVANDTYASQRHSLELTQALFNEGVASGLTLAQVRSTVEVARADVATFTAQVGQDQNALNLLIGAPLSDDLRPAGLDEISFGADDLPPGLPSAVLLSRPDIRQSEHELRAANADVGAARAAFFPSISIAGFGGQTDPSLDSLFSGATRIWSFTPQVNIPIFHGGALIGQLGLADAEKNIAVAQYEHAIQIAFREVADALAIRGTIGETLDARQNLLAATQETFSLSQARYDEGVDSYLTLLDSQRSLYVARQSFVAARAAHAINFITLYKALGGGLDAER